MRIAKKSSSLDMHIIISLHNARPPIGHFLRLARPVLPVLGHSTQRHDCVVLIFCGNSSKKTSRQLSRAVRLAAYKALPFRTLPLKPALRNSPPGYLRCALISISIRLSVNSICTECRWGWHSPPSTFPRSWIRDCVFVRSKKC